MNFIKSLSAKTKIIIIAIIVIIIGYISINALNKPTPKKALDSLSVSFSGYNGSGYASYNSSKDDDKKAYTSLKEIALIEAKKAQIDTKAVEQVIKSTSTTSELASKLTDSDTFANSSSSTSELIKYSNFQDHLEKTSIRFDKSMSLSNGTKVVLTLQDDSSVPYFEKVSKTYTVKGLKKPKTVTLSEKDFNIKTDGTDGFGSVDIKYGKKSVFSSSDSSTKHAYKNGDIISVKSAKIKDYLDTDSTKYKINSKTLKFKISNFPSSNIKLSGVDTIVKDDSSISDGDTLVSAFISSDKKDYTKSPKLYLFLKNSDGKTYYRSYDNSYKDLKIENNGLKINTDEHYYSFFNYSTIISGTPEKQMADNSDQYIYKIQQ